MQGENHNWQEPEHADTPDCLSGLGHDPVGECRESSSLSPPDTPARQSRGEGHCYPVMSDAGCEWVDSSLVLYKLEVEAPTPETYAHPIFKLDLFSIALRMFLLHNLNEPLKSFVDTIVMPRS